MPDAMLSPPALAEQHEGSAGRCPPEDSCLQMPHDATPESSTRPEASADAMHTPPMQQPTPPPAEQDLRRDAQSQNESRNKVSDTEIDAPIRDIPTPISSTEDAAEYQRNAQTSPLTAQPAAPNSWNSPQVYASPFPTQRFIPNSTSSFLRPGSRFKGDQTSDRQRYDVEVEIKHVDMKESFLCGYLRIRGLTEDHPSLTTYFEGEIIGSKYSFITQHPEWGSNEKVDRQHWGRFPAYKPLSSKFSSRPDQVSKNSLQNEYIFMRWKEYFLVPDHRVRTINGASFEGFYYICFNQVSGDIEGIYFHAKSEKYQKLALQHVEDHGCQGAMEFR